MKILITGGARNIGKILAEYLDKKHHQVMIHHNSSNVNKKESIKLDFTKSYDIFANSDFIPDLMINNAAVFEKDDLDCSNANKIFDVNFFAPISITKDFYKLNPKGIVVNILDVWAESLPQNFKFYSLSKLALQEYTRNIKGYSKPFKMIGIKIGATILKENQKKEIFDKIPQTSTEDICKAVDFIISHDLQSGNIIDLTNANSID